MIQKESKLYNERDQPPLCVKKVTKQVEIDVHSKDTNCVRDPQDEYADGRRSKKQGTCTDLSKYDDNRSHSSIRSPSIDCQTQR